jgi:pimeloyl-ACP methyl ester carboxylesterase
MEIASIDGVELAYHVAGRESGQPILLLHRYTGSHEDWTPSVAALTAAGWHALSPDNPGHGQSSAPEDFEIYRLERVAAMLKQLAEGLDFMPAVVAGQGMGAAIAEEYALQFPSLVRALVLVASAGGAAVGVGSEPAAAHIDELRGVHEQGGMAAVFDRQVEMGLRPDAVASDADKHDQARRRFAELSWPGYEFAGLALRTRRSTLPGLGQWRKPTLIVYGAGATPPIVSVANDLQAAIPHARREVIAGALNGPQHEAPNAFNRVLLHFLSSI